MKAHGFRAIPEIPYQCAVCRRFERDRLHDSWHLRLIWHPATFPVVIIVSATLAVIGFLI